MRNVFCSVWVKRVIWTLTVLKWSINILIHAGLVYFSCNDDLLVISYLLKEVSLGMSMSLGIGQNSKFLIYESST